CTARPRRRSSISTRAKSGSSRSPAPNGASDRVVGADPHSRTVVGFRVSSRILIIDYGSQFTQLIARRVREARVYSEIHPPTRSLDWIRDWKPTGIILSGGPNSVYEDGAPGLEPGVLDLAPVLAICYGMQLVAQNAGGAVKGAGRREYGRAELEIEEPDGLFAGFAAHECTTVWMSHGDHVDAPPPGYVVTASSRSVPVAAIRHRSRPVHGVQFHPEVA